MVKETKFYCLRSLIYNKNRSPRIDPWGTPQFIAARPYFYPFTDTYWLWLDRYDLNQLFYKSYSYSSLPTVSGGLQYQKLFASLQKLHNCISIIKSFSYLLSFKAWDVELLPESKLIIDIFVIKEGIMSLIQVWIQVWIHIHIYI